jgi:hypothetical protein
MAGTATPAMTVAVAEERELRSEIESTWGRKERAWGLRRGRERP